VVGGRGRGRLVLRKGGSIKGKKRENARGAFCALRVRNAGG